MVKSLFAEMEKLSVRGNKDIGTPKILITWVISEDKIMPLRSSKKIK
jgi:hypothetical protein